jgi:hypothetical protein
MFQERVLIDDVKVRISSNNVLVGWRYGAGCPIEDRSRNGLGGKFATEVTE